MPPTDLARTLQQLTATRPDLVRGVMLWSQDGGLMGCLMDAQRQPILRSIPSMPHADPTTLFAHLASVRGYLELTGRSCPPTA
ncbi:MAG: hypothetical protein EI684_02780 [Candidatus Viridilinea halotolerans]|uniref:Uncharacterized protein n=1 Tax=Candidatus Viridilinea halotolerans TaxID=2491704 RepID=A0A426U8L6_9CHLR|nr:MAG: hypothetical protein EI684_02780 [Candidatus Viridilinea halotolerans]